VEYQGVDTKTQKALFSAGPFEDGTVNIAEFLAIVHALAYCKQRGITLPIYSDSRNAIGWVADKQVRTKHTRTETSEKLFQLIDRALAWLNNNEYVNPILKWETRAWGENPADFGRK
jgi:ribonuclease HI